MFILQSVCLTVLLYQFCNGGSYFSQEVDEKGGKTLNAGVALVMKSENMKNTIEKVTGYGKDLITDMYFFLEELKVLLKAVEEENFALTESQVTTIKALKQNGGPSHLKAKVKNGLLIGKYGWSSIELNDFVEMLKDTKTIWEKLEKTAVEKKIL